MKKIKKIVSKTSPKKLLVKTPKKLLITVGAIVLAVSLLYGLVRLTVVALVNGRPIFRCSVIKDLEKQYGAKSLDVLILKALINQEAKKNKIIVTQKDVDAEIKKIETSVTAQGMSIDALLAQQGMTKDDLNSEIKIQLMVTKLAGEKMSVTEKEIDDYLVTLRESSTAEMEEEPTRTEIKNLLEQQKVQENIQTYLGDLKTKAKINYLIKY